MVAWNQQARFLQRVASRRLDVTLGTLGPLHVLCICRNVLRKYRRMKQRLSHLTLNTDYSTQQISVTERKEI